MLVSLELTSTNEYEAFFNLFEINVEKPEIS